MRDLLRRRLGTVVLVAVVLLGISATRLATFATDWWWYDEVGAGDVFTGIWLTRLVLALIAGGGLAILLAANLHIARRLRPLVLPSTPQQAIVERYREMADPYLPWLIAGVAILFGLTAGSAAAADWEPFVLWRNAQPFGIEDPQFGRDIGFYVFTLPVLKAAQGWLFTTLLLVGVLTAGAHYLLGGIRPEAQAGDRVLPRVRLHLSILLIAILAVRGWGYWLDRYLLNYSPRGQVTGASYTDVNAELPALYLLLGITVVAIVLVLVSLRRRGFLLPGVAIAILVVGSILLQGAYPAIIQRLRVEPQELPREERFIARNLEATRAAYGLEDVESLTFTPGAELAPGDLEAEAVTFENVRLWEPGVLGTTYGELQALRPYYSFRDVDVDRYDIDGELRQVMLSVRELSTEGLQSSAQSWQNLTFRYTHGYGVVASQVNTATAAGQPVFLSRDIPPRGSEELDPEQEAGVYYGESPAIGYSVVQGAPEELDYEDPETLEAVPTTYDGDGGVPVGTPLRRLAFALRFGETNMVLSDLIQPDSKVLFRRQVRERVAAVAPYLALDPDPYPVVLDGRIVWVQDAYTRTDWYPYSERRQLRLGDAAERVNYVRNSVKAVVDAYDGTVTLYVVDDSDPIVAAWREAFPSRYADEAEAPEGLAPHWRYPQAMFELQAELHTTYHIRDVGAFYEKADEYAVPEDPAVAVNQANANAQAVDAPPLEPYYLLMRLPGEEEEEFVLIQPYLARGKENMVAWLAGRSDGERLGDLFAVQFPTDASVLGPGQAQTRIEQDPTISEYITLRNQSGSRVIRGNLLVLPVGEAIVYVEPLFLAGGSNEIPELDKVAVVLGDRVAFEDSLDRALQVLVGEATPTDPVGEIPDVGEEPTEPDEQPTEPSGDPDELLRQALEAFQQADAALADGDLGRYQQLVERGRDLLERAAAARGVTAEQSPGPSPQPSPTG